jgi:hypothetical protein
MEQTSALLKSRLATDLPLFLETSLFFMAKAAPQKNKNGNYPLGALIMPRSIAGLVKPQQKRKREVLPPAVENAMQNWLCTGDTKFVSSTQPLELEKPGVPHKRMLLEYGMKTLAQHIPILPPDSKCVSPPVSTSDHDNAMLYYTRLYGKTMAPLCAHGSDGCVGATLPKAPGPLPIYLSMAEEKAAQASEETAKQIFAETGSRSLCLLCIRAECNAMACGLSDKMANSALELHRHVAIMPPFTNLMNVPGGYFDWAIGVNPAVTPQISLCAVVTGNPVQENGETVLSVQYNRATAPDGREYGLHVNQDAIIWRPSLN